jgi:hypothetical protein
MFSSGAKIIASSGLLFLQTWLLVDVAQGPMRTMDAARKAAWLTQFSAAVSESATPGLGSVEDQARAEADGYSIMLVPEMWVTDEDDQYGLN